MKDILSEALSNSLDRIDLHREFQIVIVRNSSCTCSMLFLAFSRDWQTYRFDVQGRTFKQAQPAIYTAYRRRVTAQLYGLLVV